MSGRVSFDGYSTTTTRSVQVNQVPDTTPPTVAITSVSDGATFTSASLLVSGTATDGAAGNGIAYVTVNGLPASNGAASGANTANWSAIVPLYSGVNTIIALASDTLGNLAETEVTVTYNAPKFNSPIVAGPSLTTTLTGLSVGEQVSLQYSTDLKIWNTYAGYPINVTASTPLPLEIRIPIDPTSSGTYFQVLVLP